MIWTPSKHEPRLAEQVTAQRREIEALQAAALEVVEYRGYLPCHDKLRDLLGLP